MLNPASWSAHAADLEPGRSKRADHDCGSGRTLLVSREGNDYKAWCFRCNEPGFIKGPEETMAERLARLSEVRAAEGSMGRAELPSPALRVVSDWPDKASLWFYKAGLSKHDIGRLGAYYHAPSRRVVLPVRQGEEVVFWQARALDPHQLPKYMAPDVDKTRVLPKYGSAGRITLVEDILSAYKVGLVGEGWCLMGTSLSAFALAQLMKRKAPVNVWLDNDLPPKFPVNRGQIAAAKVVKQLRAMGLEVRNIVAPRDPKLMTRAEIEELIT
jgi:DNA primase